jgi:tRNA-specific 2-thiouridylase
MPFYEYDLSERFRAEVIEPFVKGYQSGETPNPCIACNRSLKFDALLSIADELGCHYLATGHYALIEYDKSLDRWIARKAVDDSKDQSYVLYTLLQEQLARVILPLGKYHKTEIRAMAEAAGFPNAHKSDSQDICFIPSGDYVGFIEEYQGKPCEPGPLKELCGRIVGTHKGLAHYTIGQRKGLGAHRRPVFVQSINARDNSITIGDDEEALKARTFIVRDVNWLIPAHETEHPSSHETEPLSCEIKIGYKHAPKSGVAYRDGLKKEALVTFDEPQRAITPGQAAVFYQGSQVVGGGTINRIVD